MVILALLQHTTNHKVRSISIYLKSLIKSDRYKTGEENSALCNTCIASNCYSIWDAWNSKYTFYLKRVTHTIELLSWQNKALIWSSSLPCQEKTEAFQGW